MAKIQKVSPSTRFPKKPKGSPKAGPTPTGAKPDRKHGSGNAAFGELRKP